MKTLLLILFIGFSSLTVFAQTPESDPEFTQIMAIPMYQNPAFAGIQQNLRIGLQYRLQWPELNQNTITVLSADMGFPKINSGVGLVYTAYQMDGITYGNSIGANYAYEIKTGEQSSLRFGLSAAVLQKTTDFGGAIIDPKTGASSTDLETTPAIGNFGLGALYYRNNFYAGLAVHNLLQPQVIYPKDTDILARRIVFQTGGFIKVGSFTLNPYLFVMTQDYSQIMPGINFNWGMFTLGSSFRSTDGHADAVNFLVGFAKGKFKICYSYDQNFRYYPVPQRSSHEFSIVFQLSKPHDTSSKPMIEHLRGAF